MAKYQSSTKTSWSWLATGYRLTQSVAAGEHLPQRPLLNHHGRAQLAPILVADRVEGLLVLLDKPGGFSAADSVLEQIGEVLSGMLASDTRNGSPTGGASVDCPM